MLDANNQMHSSGYFSFSLHRQLNDAMPEYPKKISFSLANELFFFQIPSSLETWQSHVLHVWNIYQHCPKITQM